MNCSCRVMPLGNFSSLSPPRRNELLAAAKDLEAAVVTLAEAISSAPEGSRCLLVPLLTSARGDVARVAETLQRFARGESGKDGLGTPVLSDPGGSTPSTTATLLTIALAEPSRSPPVLVQSNRSEGLRHRGRGLPLGDGGVGGHAGDSARPGRRQVQAMLGGRRRPHRLGPWDLPATTKSVA